MCVGGVYYQVVNFPNALNFHFSSLFIVPPLAQQCLHYLRNHVLHTQQQMHELYVWGCSV